MAFDVLAAANEAAKISADMNEVQTFEGSDFEPPVAGVARLRFIEYIELGKFQEDYQGQPKTVEKVSVAFELSGPKYPAKDINGVMVPHVIRFKLNKSLTDKSKFYKLFVAMNHDKQAKHMAQMLGKSFLGRVVHKTVAGKDGAPDKTYANLQDQNGYTITGPMYEDPTTGVSTLLEADPVRSQLRIFTWDVGSKGMWDSIYIDGKWPDKMDGDKLVKAGTSKNYFQNLIKTALNYVGSPASECSLGDIDVDDAVAPERTPVTEPAQTGAAADPLAGI